MTFDQSVVTAEDLVSAPIRKIYFMVTSAKWSTTMRGSGKELTYQECVINLPSEFMRQCIQGSSKIAIGWLQVAE